MGKWIGVDLDGTLAEYHGPMGNAIGRPIPAMLNRVKDWLDAGIEVRIFTARAGDPEQHPEIQAWLAAAGIPGLPITNIKDFEMAALWDDRAVRVKRNTGHVCGGCVRLRRSLP